MLRRLLVVDCAFSDSLAASLAREFVLDVCSSGREALAAFAAGSEFDVMLASLGALDVDPVTFLAELRTLGWESSRVAFLSSGHVDRAVRVGVADLGSVIVDARVRRDELAMRLKLVAERADLAAEFADAAE